MQKNNPSLTNIHANCLMIGNKGILICGKTGSGKSTLSLQLLHRASVENSFCALIADDQVLVSGHNNSAVAMCPPVIAGQIEIRGFGITEQAHVPSAIIDLVVNIVPAAELDRMPEISSKAICEIQRPSISVPQFQWQQAVEIVMAKIGNNRIFS